MLYALALNSIIEIFLNGYYTGKLIGYGPISQIIDFGPTLLLSAFSGIISWFALSFCLINNNFFEILLYSICFTSVYLFLVYIFKVEALSLYKKIILNRFYN